MRRYKVVFVAGADEDLANIYDYICRALSSPPGAKKILNEIRRRCGSLKYFPKEGSPGRIIDGQELRHMHCGRYKIFYFVDDTSATVEIYAIKYARKDLEDIVGENK